MSQADTETQRSFFPSDSKSWKRRKRVRRSDGTGVGNVGNAANETRKRVSFEAASDPKDAPSIMPPFEAPVSASASDASISRGGTARLASSHLRPEDAFLAYSPPYRSTSKGGASENRRKRDSHSSRNASRRRPRTWKKLLWVKQACMRRTVARDVVYKSANTESSRSRQLHR